MEWLDKILSLDSGRFTLVAILMFGILYKYFPDIVGRFLPKKSNLEEGDKPDHVCHQTGTFVKLEEKVMSLEKNIESLAEKVDDIKETAEKNREEMVRGLDKLNERMDRLMEIIMKGGK